MQYTTAHCRGRASITARSPLRLYSRGRDPLSRPRKYNRTAPVAVIHARPRLEASLLLQQTRATFIKHSWDFYRPVGWPTNDAVMDVNIATGQYEEAMMWC